MVKCPKEEIDRYFGESATYYYRDTICLKYSNQTEITSDWWTKNYKNFVVALEKCNLKKCASEKERQDYFE